MKEKNKMYYEGTRDELIQQIYEAADLFYMRKDQRRYCREDPSVCGGRRDVCYEYEKVLCVWIKKLCSS